jgi:hypothetical protein
MARSVSIRWLDSKDPRALTRIVLIGLIAGCDPRPTAPPDDPAVAVVDVSPVAMLITTIGGSRSFSATARDGDGQELGNVSVVWNSTDESVATVSTDGRVTAVGPGETVIHATAGGIDGEASLTVQISAVPPVVFSGGTVITMDPVSRIEEALVVLDDRVFATGTSGDMQDLVGPAGLEIDLGGSTLMPGFVDPHNHVYGAVFLGHAADEVGTSYTEAEDRLIAAGITTLANGNVWPDLLAHLLTFVNGGTLRARTGAYLGYNSNCGDAWPDDWYLAHSPSTDSAARFRVLGVKYFTDGGSCNRPAATYYGDGGDLYLTSTELAAELSAIQSLGYQALIHALGDIAADSALQAVEDALAGGPNLRRHRIDHNRYLRPYQWPRYGEVGAIPVVFGSPFTCRIEDGGEWSFLADDAFAPFRPRFDPWRALLDANPGHRIAWKSDSPGIWPIQPILHLWGLVTRNEVRGDGSICQAPEWLAAGAVTVGEALRMMTIDAAYVLHMDDVVGSLADGKFADLIVISDDPLSVAPAEILDIEVRMTMIGGRVEFCQVAQEHLCPGGTNDP